MIISQPLLPAYAVYESMTELCSVPPANMNDALHCDVMSAIWFTESETKRANIIITAATVTCSAAAIRNTSPLRLSDVGGCLWQMLTFWNWQCNTRRPTSHLNPTLPRMHLFLEGCLECVPTVNTWRMCAFLIRVGPLLQQNSHTFILTLPPVWWYNWKKRKISNIVLFWFNIWNMVWSWVSRDPVCNFKIYFLGPILPTKYPYLLNSMHISCVVNYKLTLVTFLQIWHKHFHWLSRTPDDK